MGIRKSALHMYEIIYYLYSCLPNFVSLDEMPSYNIDEKYKSTMEGMWQKSVFRTGKIYFYYLYNDVADNAENALFSVK